MHAITSVDIDPKNSKTLTYDFTLGGGKSRSLTVRGVDGKLPKKLLAVGQSEAIEPKAVVGGTLELTGLSAKRSRAVVLLDEAKTVGAVAAVTGDAEAPVTVTLEKLGSVSGRVFDAEGAPAVGAEVRAWLVLDHEKYENLPYEDFHSGGVLGIAPGAWAEFTSRFAKTDKDGRFTLQGILPGQPYRFAAGFNLKKPDDELLHCRRAGVIVKPGEAQNLGDLKPTK
jgi:hypothetical protein